eukprot:TRINITY_DN5941_c0_g1_i1.p2 TRINITY_DN5941_c0_g1~~TRINITY_DN5941_c0_g1_i1.p2  ORF type:complete len:318 (-),score=45.29 TRINITY_DN5941_c0_g1_i1:2245-3198(-)
MGKDSCGCKAGCAARCVCRKAGRECTAACTCQAACDNSVSEVKTKLPAWMSATVPKAAKRKAIAEKRTNVKRSDVVSFKSDDMTRECAEPGNVMDDATLQDGGIMDMPTMAPSDAILNMATIANTDNLLDMPTISNEDRIEDQATILDGHAVASAGVVTQSTPIVTTNDQLTAPPPPPSPDRIVKRTQSQPYVRTQPGRLRLISLNPRHATIELNGPGALTSIVVGRASSCSSLTRFPDSKHLSARHCVFEVSEDGVVVVVDHSSNGTFVNGDLVGSGRTKHLSPGDEISLTASSAYEARSNKLIAETYVAYIVSRD